MYLQATTLLGCVYLLQCIDKLYITLSSEHLCFSRLAVIVSSLCCQPQTRKAVGSISIPVEETERSLVFGKRLEKLKSLESDKKYQITSVFKKYIRK